MTRENFDRTISQWENGMISSGEAALYLTSELMHLSSCLVHDAVRMTEREKAETDLSWLEAGMTPPL